jgi:hypothetical protein
MIEGHNIDDELLLMNDDFPDYFIEKAHPTDYISVSQPISIEYIYHKKQFHNRLIVRISWQISPHSYVPMSFVIDTGAPNGFYLSPKAFKCLQQRIHTDEMDNQYVIIQNTKEHTKKLMVCPTPSNHCPANIIGLKTLMFLGLELNEDEKVSFPWIPVSL